jgi:hypothetical protein
MSFILVKNSIINSLTDEFVYFIHLFDVQTLVFHKKHLKKIGTFEYELMFSFFRYFATVGKLHIYGL